MHTKPKKSLGQNFLRDPKILEKIANAAKIEKTDIVVEIGPGEGTLTKFLLERAAKVIAIEKDEQLADKLKAENLEVIVGDVLKKNIDIFLENDYILVGNIPYYITGEIFRKFLESEHPPKSLTFVVQKEVADRIMARDDKESILSISIKAYGEPEYGGIIKAGSFSPAPKVDSAIISVRNINKSNFAKTMLSEKEFFAFLKKGFAHKRKLLRSNLGLSKGIFNRLNLNPKIRAEELSVDDWFAILKLCQEEKLSPSL